jgi:hypothetical protein
MEQEGHNPALSIGKLDKKHSGILFTWDKERPVVPKHYGNILMTLFVSQNFRGISICRPDRLGANHQECD